MGLILQEHQHLLRKRIDEVLHYMWDPIGVAGTPEARDEYDSYIPRIYGMLLQGMKEQEISNYLKEVETESMGMTFTPEADKRNNEISELLVSWMDRIEGWDKYHTRWGSNQPVVSIPLRLRLHSIDTPHRSANEMNLFRRKSIIHKRDGCKVYRKYRKPITEISNAELDRSKIEFRNAIIKSISPDSYRIITKEAKTQDPEYIQYTEDVRNDLIEEFYLVADSVKIGLYHGGQYVLSFPKVEKIDYPFFYKGIQLKPYEPEEQIGIGLPITEEPSHTTTHTDP